MHARPLATNWIAANVPALVGGGYAGEEVEAAGFAVMIAAHRAGYGKQHYG